MALAPIAVLPPHVYATLPTGAQVVHGNVAINQAGGAMNIRQASQNAIVNWQTFNIGAGNSVRIEQGGAQAAMLARVVGGDPSKLLGALKADGKLFLINPRGIVVGEGAVIDTAGFLGSTLDVTDAEFLAGGAMTFKGGSEAGVVNLGRIIAREGNVMLFAHSVKNAGEIVADKGTVGLGAGTEVLLAAPNASGFVIKTNLAATAEKTGVDNSGVIAAAQAQLEAAGGSVYELAVNQSGVVRATGSAVKNGRVLLTAQGGTVGVSGEVSARNANGSGGEILIGGDFRGENAEVANATRTVVTQTAKLDASAANEAASAGRVIVWADGATRFLGSLEATGAGGGFAEVSGKRWLDFNPATTVQLGRGGTLLLDPDALIISDEDTSAVSTSGSDPFSFSVSWEVDDIFNFDVPPPSILNVATLQDQLAVSNVVLDTSTAFGDVSFNVPVTWANDNTLTVRSGNNININADITGGADSTLELYTGIRASGIGELGFPDINGEAWLAADATIKVGTLVYGANEYAQYPDIYTPDGDTPSTGYFFIDGNLDVNTLRVDLSAGDAGVSTWGTNNTVRNFHATGSGMLSAYVENHNGDLDVTFESTRSGSTYLQFLTPGNLTLTSGSNLDFVGPPDDPEWRGNILLVSMDGEFVNDAGASAFGENSRYLIYTSTAADTRRGGLAPGAYVFNQAFDPDDTSFDGDTTSRIIYSGDKPTVTYTADDLSRTYGAANPTATATASGFVDGDTAAVIDGAPVLTHTATATSNVGDHTINATIGTLASSFYDIAVAPGTLTIDPATLTYNATSASRTYGSSNPALTGTVTGFVNGETLATATSGIVSFTTSATSASNVGHYAINGSGLTANHGNYVFDQAAANATALTIDPATLTYTAQAASRTYGSANPAFTGNVTGFVNGETLDTATSGTATFSSTANASTHVGTAAIDGSGLTANHGNYVFVQAAANSTALTIDPATLTYTATAATRTYGDANPTFTGTVTGFVNGETLDTATTGTASFTSTATLTTHVGNYAIDGSGLTANHGNYVFVQASGNASALTIEKALLEVTAKDVTRTYGDANPTFEASITGFKNTDTDSVVSGLTVDTTVATNASSSAGGYTIAASGATATNYTFNYTPGTLTVNKAPLTVTVSSAMTKTQNKPNPDFLSFISATGLKNSDNLIAAIADLAFDTTATLSSPAGEYVVSANGTSVNYIPTFVPGLLTISALPTLTYRADDQSRVYGDANPLFTFTRSELTPDADDDVTGLPALSATATQLSGVGAYTINIEQGTLASNNYQFSFAPGTLTITPAPLTVAIAAASRFYGDANPSFGFNVTGLKNSDPDGAAGIMAYTTAASATSNVGGYTINGTLSGTNANYTATVVPGTLTIDPAPLAIAVDHKSRTYGNANPDFTATPTGLKNADTLAVAVPDLAFATAATSTSNVGDYAITATGNSTNYALTFTPGLLSISKALLTYTATNASRVYGDINPTFDHQVTGLKGADVLTSVVAGAPAFSTTATQLSGVGTYTIDISQGTLSSSNYQFNFAPGSLEITPAPLTVAIDAASRFYGDANPAFTSTITGLKNSDTAAAAGTLSTTTAAGLTSVVGSYDIFGTLSGTSANYTATVTSGTLTIEKAPLTATIANATRAPNTANPSFSASYSGFKNGETASVISGLDFTTTAVIGSPSGAYPITGSGSATNYAITFIPGTLTIGGTLNYAATSFSRVYGEANPSSLPFTVTGLLLGDVLDNVVTGAPALSTSATQSSGVGAYTINIEQGTLTSESYAFAFTPGTLTIDRAPLTVAANNKSRRIGVENPSFDASLSGFVLGQDEAVLGGTLAFATAANSGSPAGDYAITPWGLTSANYEIIFVPGVLTLTETAALLISANNASRTYGAANPQFTASYSGFVGSDTESVVSGLQFSTTATQTSGIGKYSITPFGATAAGYDISYESGTLTIERASLTISVPNQSRFYGDANDLTVNFNGLVNGETSAVVSGLSVSTDATPTSNVGTYAINASGATADNYSISYSQGSLTVAPAPLTVMIDPATRRYGDPDPVFTYSITGLKNGESENLVTVHNLGSLASANSGIGSYGIIGFPSVASSNYSVSAQVSGSLTVTPRPLTIRANDTSRVYGDANPTFTATFDGLASFDTPALFGDLALTTQATQSSGVGEWGITFSRVAHPNYSITSEFGTLTITPATLVIDPLLDVWRVYGRADPVAGRCRRSAVSRMRTPSPVSGSISPVCRRRRRTRAPIAILSRRRIRTTPSRLRRRRSASILRRSRWRSARRGAFTATRIRRVMICESTAWHSTTRRRP